MPIPDFQTLMLPVLKSAIQGERRIADVVEQLAEDFSLTQQEREQLLPSGRQTQFANRVNWAKSYLNKAGLVENTRRGHFILTQRSQEVLAQRPPKIDRKFLSQFDEFQGFVAIHRHLEEPTQEERKEPTQELAPDELMREAYLELESTLAEELLQRVRSGSPAFFEALVIRLLLAMGYGGQSAEDMGKALVGGTGDGGIDGIIDQDPLGLDRIYIQAKRYGEGNTVGAGAIRDFFGSLDRFKASKGLFITTSDFTQQARETAEMLSKRIMLINGKQLSKLMIRHRVGCRVEETLEIRRLDEEFFG